MIASPQLNQPPTRPPRWAFFSHAYNLGDCSRAVEVAVAMKAAGAEVRFFHRGGTYVDIIAQAGLEPVPLEPFITPEQDAILMAMDQHRAAIGTPFPFTETQWVSMVESELAAFREFSPDGVYCGLNLSSMISVPHAGLPMVTLVPTALCPSFFRANLASFPDVMDTPMLRRWVPGWVKRRAINRIMLGKVAKKSARGFNRVRQRYGLGPIYNLTALVRGDLTILPDLPELSGLAAEDLPAGYTYSGPLFARMQLPVPEQARRVLSQPGLKIYCAMGSSVPPGLLKQVIGILRELPQVNVVCATTRILDPEELGPATEDFFATRFLPAQPVNELADLAVIHGGQGTVQTAVWAGTPVIGVGMQWEQQANLDALERAGAGVRIPLYAVDHAAIVAGIARANTASCRTQMAELSRRVRACDGASAAVRQMNALLASRSLNARGALGRSLSS